MDPASLEGRHGLQLEHLASLDDPLGGPLGNLAKLALAAATVVLDVDEDARPGPHLAGEHEVHDVLEGAEPLALAPDKGTERLSLVALAGHVEAARLRGLDGNHDIEAHHPEELLEDELACGERLGRRLGGLELGALRGDGSTEGIDLGGLALGQITAATRSIVPRRPVLTGWAIVAARPVVPPRPPIGTPVVSARPAVATIFTGPVLAWRDGRAVLAWRDGRPVVAAWAAVVEARSVVSPRSAIGTPVIAARAAVAVTVEGRAVAPVLARWRSRKRP